MDIKPHGTSNATHVNSQRGTSSAGWTTAYSLAGGTVGDVSHPKIALGSTFAYKPILHKALHVLSYGCSAVLRKVPWHITIRPVPLAFVKRHTALLVAAAAGVAMVAAGGWTAVSYASQGIVVASVADIDHNQPISFSFERTVRDGLTYELKEEIKGAWKVERALGGIRGLIFTPESTLAPGSVLHIELGNLRPLADLSSGTPSQQIVTVVVRKAPDVQAIVPAMDATQVLVDTVIQLKLSAPNNGLRQLQFSGDLPVESPVPTSTDDVTFTWKLTAPLAQGTTYTALVIDTAQPPEKQTIAEYRFATATEPIPASVVDGFIKPGSTITVGFDQDMVQASDAVQFAMPGSGSWKDARTYVFSVGAVAPGTTYDYSVKAGAKSAAGGFVANPKTFSARTPGSVRVTGVQPSGGRVALDTTVRVTFDQPVDQASAEAAFSMTPRVDGTFSWSGATMQFHPTGLQYQTVYTVSVAAGIAPVFGLPGMAHSQRFTTTYQVVKLAVPFYRQAHALSCESASLRMALGYYGVRVIDDDVMALVGGSKGPRDTATNTWDDPYQTFVGNVDGRMGVTGWGVYSGPIASAAQSLGRQATAIGGGVSAQQIATAIYAGNPVVLWGVSGWGAVEDSWNTATSGVVRAPRNEHVRVVYGVEGSAADPVGFYVYDPLGGSAGLHWTVSQLRTNSAAGGGHAVIVR